MLPQPIFYLQYKIREKPNKNLIITCSDIIGCLDVCRYDIFWKKYLSSTEAVAKCEVI